MGAPAGRRPGRDDVRVLDHRQPYCDGAKEWLRLFSRAVFPAEPGEISMLHALFYLRSGGGLEKMIGTVNSAQEPRISRGSQQLSLRLAELLGDRVRLGCPVPGSTIAPTPSPCTTTAALSTARRVIAAIPPVLAGRVRYSPPMPGVRDQLTQRSFMGAIIKVHVVYERPFWREDGLSGHATTDTGYCRSPSTRATPAGRRHDRRLHRLPTTPRPRRSSPRRNDGRGDRGPRPDLRQAGAYPIAYYERSWIEEEWSRGCYAGMLSPGTWSTLGHALREPVGPIHWAGTETAVIWNGYMDGAIRPARTRPPRFCPGWVEVAR